MPYELQEAYSLKMKGMSHKMAENLHKSAGFVPGIRPGDATEKYFEKVLTKVSLVGGVFAALLAILPILISNSQLQGIQFGGTSLLIMVGVGLDFSRQLDSQLDSPLDPSLLPHLLLPSSLDLFIMYSSTTSLT